MNVRACARCDLVVPGVLHECVYVCVCGLLCSFVKSGIVILDTCVSMELCVLCGVKRV